MTDEQQSKPKYLDSLEKTEFNDAELEKLKNEIVSKLSTIIVPISVHWDKINKIGKDLSEEAKDDCWDICRWPTVALNYINEIDYYKRLKEEEARYFAEFIVKIAERLKKMEESQVPIEQIDFDTIMDRAKELMSNNPDMPLKIVVGKVTVEGELNKEFGIDAKEIIEQAVSKLEEQDHG